MKKALFCAAAALSLAACTSNKYRIEGSIEGLAGTLYLYDEQQTPVDSAVVEQGAFRLSGVAETPGRATLLGAMEDGTPVNAAVILEPGTIVVAADRTHDRLSVTGTPSNDAATAYRASVELLSDEFRAAELSDARREEILEEYEALSRSCFEANTDNYFGAMVLAGELAYELSGKELLEAVGRFPASLRATKLLTDLEAAARQKMLTDIGEPFIEIEQPDASGNPVSLRSVVEHPDNEYVLVDFWASWCGPCMGEVPFLKQAYDKFHAKGFEIYGISLDKYRDAWLDAVEQHAMNWIHVSELNAFDCQAVSDYAVRGIPSNFLLDARGTIVAKNLRGEQLCEKLEELLGK